MSVLLKVFKVMGYRILHMSFARLQPFINYSVFFESISIELTLLEVSNSWIDERVLLFGIGAIFYWRNYWKYSAFFRPWIKFGITVNYKDYQNVKDKKMALICLVLQIVGSLNIPIYACQRTTLRVLIT